MIWPAVVSARNNTAVVFGGGWRGLRLYPSLELFIQVFDCIQGSNRFPTASGPAARLNSAGISPEGRRFVESAQSKYVWLRTLGYPVDAGF
jgi:hypothetical protein